MIELLWVVYSPWLWMPPAGWALIAWLAVTAATARVVGPLLRRNTTHYPTVELEEARDGR